MRCDAIRGMAKRQLTVRVSEEMAGDIDRIATEFGIARGALLNMAVTLGIAEIKRARYVDSPRGGKR